MTHGQQEILAAESQEEPHCGVAVDDSARQLVREAGSARPAGLIRRNRHSNQSKGAGFAVQAGIVRSHS